MLEKYLEELEAELQKQEYFDIEDALRQTKNQIRRGKKLGKTDEEILDDLGSISECVDNLFVDNCPKSKNEILMNDIIFWGLATPLACLCTLAMIFIAILCGISGAMFTVKAWTDPVFTTAGMKIAAFVLALCGLAMFALAGWLSYKIAMKMRYGISRHLRLKKYSMEKVKNGEYDE